MGEGTETESKNEKAEKEPPDKVDRGVAQGSLVVNLDVFIESSEVSFGFLIFFKLMSAGLEDQVGHPAQHTRSGKLNDMDYSGSLRKAKRRTEGKRLDPLSLWSSRTC